MYLKLNYSVIITTVITHVRSYVHMYVPNKQIVLFTSLLHCKGQILLMVLVTSLMLVTYVY